MAKSWRSTTQAGDQGGAAVETPCQYQTGGCCERRRCAKELHRATRHASETYRQAIDGMTMRWTHDVQRAVVFLVLAVAGTHGGVSRPVNAWTSKRLYSLQPPRADLGSLATATDRSVRCAPVPGIRPETGRDDRTVMGFFLDQPSKAKLINW